MLHAMNPPALFRIVPLPSDPVDEARRTSTDRLGHRLTPRIDDGPRRQCRFPLRQLRPGEEFRSMSHSPFRRDHPHRETGSIFRRRRLCGRASSAAGAGSAPAGFPRLQCREKLVDARIGPSDPEALIGTLLANPAVDCLLVRSLTHGCHTFKIERA